MPALSLLSKATPRVEAGSVTKNGRLLAVQSQAPLRKMGGYSTPYTEWENFFSGLYIDEKKSLKRISESLCPINLLQACVRNIVGL